MYPAEGYFTAGRQPETTLSTNLHDKGKIMNERPSITVTTSDYERLEQMLRNPRYRNIPSIEGLRDKLDCANVVEPEELPDNVIAIDFTACFIDDCTNDRYEITLVYPGKADGVLKIFVFAPVGSALLGLSVGQLILWQVPGRQKLHLRVLDITSPKRNS